MAPAVIRGSWPWNVLKLGPEAPARAPNSFTYPGPIGRGVPWLKDWDWYAGDPENDAGALY